MSLQSAISTMRLLAHRSPDAPQVHLIDLDVGELATQGLASACLSDQEIQAASRLRRPLDQQRYRVAHATLRTLLGQRLGVSPASLRFATGTHGKPYLPDQPKLSFNLSHSDHLGLIGLAAPGTLPMDIGVDLEIVRPIGDAEAMAREVMAPDEWSAWRHRRHHGGGFDHYFLGCWTAKEAALKAMGLGLTIAPKTLNVAHTLEGELGKEHRLDLDCVTPHRRGRLWHLDVGPQAVAAVVTLESKP